jgi:hypothetical protein
MTQNIYTLHFTAASVCAASDKIIIIDISGV